MELVGGSSRNLSSDSQECPPHHVNDRPEPGLSPDERFDASQYAFFGRDVTQEFEIGGLDEEEDAELLERENDKPVSDMADVKLREGDKPASDLGDVPELGTAFTKLNRNDMPMSEEEGETGSLGVPKTGSHAEASSQPVDLSRTSDWLDHTTEVEQGARMSWLNNQQQSTLGAVGDGQAQQLKQHWWGVDLNSVQAASPSVTPYLPQRTQHGLQALPTGHSHIARAPVGPTKPYPSLQPPLGGLNSITPYLASFPQQYSSIGPLGTPLLSSAQCFPQSNVQIAPALGLDSQQFHHHISLMPPQVVLQYQRHAPQVHAAPPSHPFNMKSQNMYNISPPPPQMLSKMGENSIALDSRDHYLSRLRQPQRHNQHSMADGNFPGRSTNNCWQPLRSKYMTVEDIENIVRIQWAATHSSDPYIDDYYHQAVQTKLSAVSSLGRRQFAPSHLRDLPSHTRASVEPHAYLQVDALGRVPFSSIRRPRPLLEVDPGVGPAGLPDVEQAESHVNGVPQHKPLEQEPMLAARIAIEDSLCLLLDVDDVDRLLSLSQAPDGGALLRQRRQLLLERLAASLELVEVNGVNSSGRTVTGRLISLKCNNDLLFLRIVSLTKGQKLLTRYLHLLTPGSELVLIVAMAVFRHLRFLFGGMHSDLSSSAAAVGLASATVLSILSMDLPALSACLAAVVSAPEQPPLRPMGSPAGDGATVVLRAVLERATGLLTDPNSAYPMQNREIWQASFDAFFKMVAQYCANKYDSIFHALMMASPGNLGAINNAAAVEMSKEMPVELLRASLPHTNDHQRKQLLEFTQRSMVMSPFPSQTGNDAHAKTASIHGKN